jgi:acetyl/propionyl-CoA carboxylase alpha subunit
MVAKLAAWGRTRTEAIERMKVALDEIEIVGVPTTVPLHRGLMRDDRFIRGDFDTNYLNDVLPRISSDLLDLEKFAVVAAAASRTMIPTPTTTPSATSEASRWRTLARTQGMTTSKKTGW